MNYYDLIYINKHDDCFSNIKNNVLVIINIILYSYGIFLKVEFCGKKKLSYNIKNNNLGYYIIISFCLSVSFLNKINSFLKKNISILRFLIINIKRKDNYISTFFIDKILNKKFKNNVKKYKNKKK